MDELAFQKLYSKFYFLFFQPCLKLVCGGSTNKRGAPPVSSSSRRKPVLKMAATSSNSLGLVNTLSEKIKRYKTGKFKINPCDVLIEPLVRPLKEFGVTRLVESFKSKENRLKAF